MPNFESPVADYMTAPAEAIAPDLSLPDAADRLRAAGVSALAVVDAEGAPVGVISRTDLLAAGSFRKDQSLLLPDSPVSEHMSSPALSVEAEAPLSAAAKLMVKKHIHRVLVTREGKLAGVLSTRDLMSAVKDKGLRLPLSEVASGSLAKVRSEDSIALAIDRLERSNKQGLIVVEGDWPVGIFDQSAALEARRYEPTTPVEEAMSLSILVLPDNLSVSRAAAQALAMKVRRILLVNEHLGLTGIVSGMDFARIAAR